MLQCQSLSIELSAAFLLLNRYHKPCLSNYH